MLTAHSFKGISSNSYLTHSSLDFYIDNCIANSPLCVSALEQYLPGCAAIRLISLRDNGLEHEVITFAFFFKIHVL